MMDERENLINQICEYLMPLIPNIRDAKNALYILMNEYEITKKCTDIALLHEDRNEDLIRHFLVAKTVNGLTPKTLYYYEHSVRKIIESIGKTVDDITADDIRYYMALRQKRDHVSNVTIGGEIRCLGSFFQWLAAEEIVMRNPMLRIDRIKVKKTKKEALTDMEVEKLRAAAVGEREKAIIEILLSTGCRVTELINIMLCEIEGNRILVHGKGQKDRYVYLNAKALFALNEYLKKRRDCNPYLFARAITVMAMDRKRNHGEMKNWWMNPRNVDQGHASASVIEQITRKIAKRAGVQQANPHKFRRTCATMALQRGMPIEQVSKMLGHEEITTTQIYLDMTEDELALAHKKYVI